MQIIAVYDGLECILIGRVLDVTWTGDFVYARMLSGNIRLRTARFYSEFACELLLKCNPHIILCYKLQHRIVVLQCMSSTVSCIECTVESAKLGCGVHVNI